jgi:hypothetical protein
VNEQEALARMVAPGTKRPGKYLSGVIQIHVTRACDKACFGCTQGSNLGGKTHFMSPAQFEQALQSLEGWWGVVGVFGGNPALHPKFETLCDLLCKYFPREQRGLWCNHPAGKAAAMRRTFDPEQPQRPPGPGRLRGVQGRLAGVPPRGPNRRQPAQPAVRSS